MKFQWRSTATRNGTLLTASISPSTLKRCLTPLERYLPNNVTLEPSFNSVWNWTPIVCRILQSIGVGYSLIKLEWCWLDVGQHSLQMSDETLVKVLLAFHCILKSYINVMIHYYYFNLHCIYFGPIPYSSFRVLVTVKLITWCKIWSTIIWSEYG